MKFSSEFVQRSLQEEYNEWYLGRTIVSDIAIGTVCIIIVGLYGLFDYLWSASELNLLLAIRFGLFVPILSALVFSMTRRSFFLRYFNYALFAFSLVLIMSFFASGLISSSNSLFYMTSMPFSMYLVIGIAWFWDLKFLYFLGIVPLFILFAADTTGGLIKEVFFVRTLFWPLIIYLIRSTFVQTAHRVLFLLYRSCQKDKTSLEKEKEISERLLLNVLPASIVERVKQKYVFILCYESVAILSASSYIHLLT